MLADNCYNLISIGLWTRTLRATKGTFRKSWAVHSLERVINLLEKKNFDVTLTRRKGETYAAMMGRLDALTTDDTPLGDELADLIIKEISSIEEVLSAEASTRKIYEIPNRRFNSDYLLNQPSRLLKKGVFDDLNEISQKDISSACRCILFGESTAAAFHILRATEGVLKEYYFYYCRTNRLTKPMWGNMLEKLRNKKTNKPSKVLLNSLDSIKEGYRNPTQHPEALYDIDEAQDLFGVCLDVIGKMGSKIYEHH